jgi:hypothetical protein
VWIAQVPSNVDSGTRQEAHLREFSVSNKKYCTFYLFCEYGSGSAWIRNDFGQLNPDPGGQKTTKKNRKREEISCFF